MLSTPALIKLVILSLSNALNSIPGVLIMPDPRSLAASLRSASYLAVRRASVSTLTNILSSELLLTQLRSIIDLNIASACSLFLEPFSLPRPRL